jgi:hypothetical protein
MGGREAKIAWPDPEGRPWAVAGAGACAGVRLVDKGAGAVIAGAGGADSVAGVTGAVDGTWAGTGAGGEVGAGADSWGGAGAGAGSGAAAGAVLASFAGGVAGAAGGPDGFAVSGGGAGGATGRSNDGGGGMVGGGWVAGLAGAGACTSSRSGSRSAVEPAATPTSVLVEESTAGSMRSRGSGASARAGVASTDDDRNARAGSGKDGYESSESVGLCRSESAVLASRSASPADSVAESGREGTSKGVGTSGGTKRLRFPAPAEPSRESSVSSADASTGRTSRSARVPPAGARGRDEIRTTSAAGTSCGELSAAFPLQSRVRCGKWRASQSSLCSGQTSPGILAGPDD